MTFRWDEVHSCIRGQWIRVILFILEYAILKALSNRWTSKLTRNIIIIHKKQTNKWKKTSTLIVSFLRSKWSKLFIFPFLISVSWSQKHKEPYFIFAWILIRLYFIIMVLHSLLKKISMRTLKPTRQALDIRICVMG